MERDSWIRNYLNSSRLSFVENMETELFAQGFPDIPNSRRDNIMCRLRQEGALSANSTLLDSIMKIDNFPEKFVKFCQRKFCNPELVKIMQRALSKYNSRFTRPRSPPEPARPVSPPESPQPPPQGGAANQNLLVPAETAHSPETFTDETEHPDSRNRNHLHDMQAQDSVLNQHSQADIETEANQEEGDDMAGTFDNRETTTEHRDIMDTSNANGRNEMHCLGNESRETNVSDSSVIGTSNDSNISSQSRNSTRPTTVGHEIEILPDVDVRSAVGGDNFNRGPTEKKDGSKKEGVKEMIKSITMHNSQSVDVGKLAAPFNPEMASLKEHDQVSAYPETSETAVDRKEEFVEENVLAQNTISFPASSSSSLSSFYLDVDDLQSAANEDSNEIEDLKETIPKEFNAPLPQELQAEEEPTQKSQSPVYKYSQSGHSGVACEEDVERHKAEPVEADVEMHGAGTPYTSSSAQELSDSTIIHPKTQLENTDVKVETNSQTYEGVIPHNLTVEEESSNFLDLHPINSSEEFETENTDVKEVHSQTSEGQINEIVHDVIAADVDTVQGSSVMHFNRTASSDPAFHEMHTRTESEISIAESPSSITNRVFSSEGFEVDTRTTTLVQNVCNSDLPDGEVNATGDSGSWGRTSFASTAQSSATSEEKNAAETNITCSQTSMENTNNNEMENDNNESLGNSSSHNDIQAADDNVQSHLQRGLLYGFGKVLNYFPELNLGKLV